MLYRGKQFMWKWFDSKTSLKPPERAAFEDTSLGSGEHEHSDGLMSPKCMHQNVWQKRLTYLCEMAGKKGVPDGRFPYFHTVLIPHSHLLESDPVVVSLT